MYGRLFENLGGVDTFRTHRKTDWRWNLDWRFTTARTPKPSVANLAERFLQSEAGEQSVNILKRFGMRISEQLKPLRRTQCKAHHDVSDRKFASGHICLGGEIGRAQSGRDM